jgi:hypothetical protein
MLPVRKILFIDFLTLVIVADPEPIDSGNICFFASGFCGPVFLITLANAPVHVVFWIYSIAMLSLEGVGP